MDHFCVMVSLYREEFDAEYQNKLAEYEEELKEWKKEVKRRVRKQRNLVKFPKNTVLRICLLLHRKELAWRGKSQASLMKQTGWMNVRDWIFLFSFTSCTDGIVSWKSATSIQLAKG